MRELVLSTTAGGPNALVGSTAFASSDSTGGDVAWRVLDGNISSSTYAWSAANISARGHWIAFDLGVGNAIDPVEMRLALAAAIDLTLSMELSHSDDGRSWQTRQLWANEFLAGGNDYEVFSVDAAPDLPSLPRLALRAVSRRNDSGHSSQVTAGRLASHSPSRVIGEEIQAVQAVRSFAGTRNAAGQPRIAMFPLLGQKRVAGSTVALGAGVACRVDLLDQATGQLAARTWSSPSGAFAFENVGPGPWTVMAVDDSGERNSVVFAHVLSVDA